MTDKPPARRNADSVSPVPWRGPRGYLYPGQPAQEGGKEPDIGKLLSILRRRRLAFAAGFVAVLALTVLGTVLMPRVYESSASFLIEKPTSSSQASALAVLEHLGRTDNVETELELIRSRRVLEPVVENLNLHVAARYSERPRELPRDSWTIAGARDAEPGSYTVERLDGGWAVHDDSEEPVPVEAGFADPREGQAGVRLAFQGVVLRGAPTTFARPIEVNVAPFGDVVRSLQEHVAVEATSRTSDVIMLTCPAPSASGAQRICDEIANQYILLRLELQRDEATAAAEFLRGQVESVGTRLAAAEDSLRTYETRNQAVALDVHATEGVRHRADLQAQREQIAAERAALLLLLDEIESGSTGTGKFRDLAAFPTFVRTQNQIVSSLVESLVELENQRGELLLTRTEESPELVAVARRIAEIEDQLRSIARSYERALGAQVASLDRTLDVYSTRLATIPAQQVETARLDRQIELLAELYGFLQTRLREAEVAQAVDLPSVRIVDQASYPTEPASPRPLLNLVLGAVLGVLAGLLLALYREHLDTRIREGQELAQEVGIPVLTMIPHVRSASPAIFSSMASIARAAGGRERVPQKDDLQKRLAAEAFWSLSTELGFLADSLENGGIRSLAITSAARGDGKTFTACNLAVTRAGLGEKTLLIDADLRAHGVSRFFKLAGDLPGMGDLLSADVPDEADLEVGVDGFANLRVMPAGRPTEQPAGLLETDHFKRLLTSAQEEYDLVLVDTPPLNIIPDAATVAAQVDGVLVVVRHGSTDRAALQYTLERLGRARARVVGIVLNDYELREQYKSYHYSSYLREADAG